MISYNHYASGAVGDFFFRRIAGLEAVEAGYKRFRAAPVVGGGLTHARAQVETPYGTAASEWRIENGEFILNIRVPMGTTCEAKLPDGTAATLESGEHCLRGRWE